MWCGVCETLTGYGTDGSGCNGSLLAVMATDDRPSAAAKQPSFAMQCGEAIHVHLGVRWGGFIGQGASPALRRSVIGLLHHASTVARRGGQIPTATPQCLATSANERGHRPLPGSHIAAIRSYRHIRAQPAQTASLRSSNHAFEGVYFHIVLPCEHEKVAGFDWNILVNFEPGPLDRKICSSRTTVSPWAAIS
ncbi:hypothetical protein MAUB_64600 (plasmid) [Mycolicibacterium aubagnense]|jgi:hypothetical protein|uniref:Uncharacterized protein n=1 Tax=Mycolicibacterium aubagnense TaxID=319707 RepID=A0ABM7IN74_9MYCO|nr:hypothetical protein MAUB_64600 [Mycolicibacterium aubagnense]